MDILFLSRLITAINAIRIARFASPQYLRQTLRAEIAFFDSSEPGSISGSITNDGNLVNQGIRKNSV